MLNLVLSGGWEGKKKKPDRPTLSEKSCGGQPNNFFFFGLRHL